MKKLMVMALGLAFAFGAVTASAQAVPHKKGGKKGNGSASDF